MRNPITYNGIPLSLGCSAFLRDSTWGVPQGDPMLCGDGPHDPRHTEHDLCPSKGLPADHPPVIACHPFQSAKEENPMPKPYKPMIVHIGRVVSLHADRAADGVTDVEATIRVEGVGDDSALMRSLGRPAVIAGDLDKLVRGMGPTEEEQAIIDAAVEWYERMVETYGDADCRGAWVQPVADAVKAMKEGK
jgi:hypothetical protein